MGAPQRNGKKKQLSFPMLMGLFGGMADEGRASNQSHVAMAY